MSLFLQVVGILALLVLALLAGLVLWIRHKLRRFADSAAEMGMAPGFVPRIQLVVDTEAIRAETLSKVESFEEAGFVRVDTFRVREMPGVRLVGLVDESASRFAVVYEHDVIGGWSDVVVYYEEGGSLTVTNSTHVGILDPRPGHSKVADPSLDERGLLARFDDEVSERERRRIAPADFVVLFEKAYADEMAWRLERGGPSLEETRRVAASMDGAYSDETIVQAQEALRAQASEALVTSCREAFAASMDGAAWERIRDRATIVHERMSGEQIWAAMQGFLIESLSKEEIVDLTSKVRSLLSSPRPPLALADAINALVPECRRLRVADTHSKPVAAVMYVAP